MVIYVFKAGHATKPIILITPVRKTNNLNLKHKGLLTPYYNLQLNFVKVKHVPDSTKFRDVCFCVLYELY
jgi:hypothetical protein